MGVDEGVLKTKRRRRRGSRQSIRVIRCRSMWRRKRRTRRR